MMEEPTDDAETPPVAAETVALAPDDLGRWYISSDPPTGLSTEVSPPMYEFVLPHQLRIPIPRP